MAMNQGIATIPVRLQQSHLLDAGESREGRTRKGVLPAVNILRHLPPTANSLCCKIFLAPCKSSSVVKRFPVDKLYQQPKDGANRKQRGYL